jgi:hypothetical protein
MYVLWTVLERQARNLELLALDTGLD